MSRALWIPGWLKLDPWLEVGVEGDYAFWREVPEALAADEPLVFYNTLWNPDDVVIARGTIKSIRHPGLGSIEKVDTSRIDYMLTLADGTTLMVNAEEEAGAIYEHGPDGWGPSTRVVNEWRFVVEFATLGQLRAVEQ